MMNVNLEYTLAVRQYRYYNDRQNEVLKKMAPFSGFNSIDPNLLQRDSLSLLNTTFLTNS